MNQKRIPRTRKVGRSPSLLSRCILLLLGIGNHGNWNPLQWASSSSSSSTSNNKMLVQADVMRPYNLDYFDTETMNYYLGDNGQPPKHDYDVAVLFYAQWDTNSHKFAPIWDTIGRLLHAGSKESNLIMGLFDCEQDEHHVKVCDQANIKHYPTVIFYSLSGQLFFHRKQRKTEKRPNPIPRHGIMFAGNWQYGDAVYDWVRTMLKLSSWHRSGWREKLRSFFQLGRGKSPKPKDQPLPLGVPSSSSSSLVGAGVDGKQATNGFSADPSSSSSSSSSQGLDQKKYENEISQLRDVAVRSGVMVDALLHPKTVDKYVSGRVAANQSLVTSSLRQENGKNYTDAFSFLTITRGWDSTLNNDTTTSKSSKKGAHGLQQEELNKNEDLVLRSCVVDLSIDYCTRLTDQITLDWLDHWTEELDTSNMTQLEQDFLDRIEKQEPYCVLVESCLQLYMEPEECRPATCPFRDPAACRYLTTCFRESIQTEYARALGLNTTVSTLTQQAKAALDAATSTTGATNLQGGGSGGQKPKQSGEENKRGWGLF
ncbi:hypothetical protein ACA910_006958 [Epithemia clementina (nom. ined.)]